MAGLAEAGVIGRDDGVQLEQSMLGRQNPHGGLGAAGVGLSCAKSVAELGAGVELTRWRWAIELVGASRNHHELGDVWGYR